MSYNPVNSPFYNLLKSASHYKLPKGQVVHALDDRSMLNLIESGYIKRYRITHEGAKSVQVIYGPNDIFPMTPVFQAIYEMKIYRGPETYYYESMTDISVYSISLETLREALEKDQTLYKDVLYAAGTRLNTYIARMEDISLRTSSWRVAYMLVFLAGEFGEQTPEGTRIQLPLTHQDLADLLDLTRETISREMVKLKGHGLILGGKNIVIPSIDKLRAVYT